MWLPCPTIKYLIKLFTVSNQYYSIPEATVTLFQGLDSVPQVTHLANRYCSAHVAAVPYYKVSDKIIYRIQSILQYPRSYRTPVPGVRFSSSGHTFSKSILQRPCGCRALL